MKSKTLFLILKVCVSIVALWVIQKNISFDEATYSGEISYFHVGVAVLFAFLTVPVVGIRWKLVSKLFNIHFSAEVATKATFTGLFIGQVLPGAIGADFVRGWFIWKMGPKARVIGSLISDRIISLLAVTVMAAATLPFLTPYLPKDLFSPRITWIHLIFGGLLFLLLPLLFKYLRKLRLIRKFLEITNSSLINENKMILISSLLLGILGHSFTILSAFFLSLALGVESSLWMWFLVMPAVIVSMTLPISINGWGVREFLMIYLWAQFGIAKSDAFLISLLFGLVLIISSLPGLWFWLSIKQKASIRVNCETRYS